MPLVPAGGGLYNGPRPLLGPLAHPPTTGPAAPAAPGFPGDAAGPFAALLRGLEDSDRALVNAITDAAGHVVSDAGTYDAQDAAHADLYRAPGS